MTKILIKDIEPFKNHPFRVVEDEALKELMESISNTGLINPVIVRQNKGKYEMISGHRRLKAMELLGEIEIEANIKDLSDDEATILMVDSNCQRERMLPSERAFAYKMKLDAIKHQGKKTSAHNGHKLSSRDKISMDSKDSSSNIQRYIRLTYLIPELLNIVDDTFKYGKNRYLTMGLLPAVELSFLSNQEQQIVYSVITYEDATPSHAQAIRIKKLCSKKFLTFDDIDKILLEEKGNQHEKIYFNKSKIISVLPFDLTKRDKRYIEQYIIEAIKLYKSTNR